MFEEKDIKSKIISSLIWKMMERIGVQGVQFIIQIVLARLLLPEDYGLLAIVTIFITFANIFIQSGFGTALIQKKDSDQLDFSTILFMSMFVAIVLYSVLFFAAPIISKFYGKQEILPILRVLSLTLFFGAINSVQNAYVSKHMMFKKLFLSSLGAIMISGLIGIILAYNNFGIWSLVAQQLVNQVLITLILWFTVKWRPSGQFSFSRLQRLFAFSWKLLLASLIDNFERDLRGLIIGRIYNPAVLGYYNRGEQFPKLIVTNVNGSIQSVMLPALAAHQDDNVRVKNMVRRTIMSSAFILFPMMFGLAFIADSLVLVLLTDKWASSVPFLRIFCASYALWPIHTANLQAINALGRSDIFLKLEIIKKIFGFLILFLSIPYGVYAIAFGMFISSLISSFINSYPNKKLLNYSYTEQWKDLIPSLILTLSMFLPLQAVKYLVVSDLSLIIIQSIVGFLYYATVSYLLKLESFMYLLSTITESVKKRI